MLSIVFFFATAFPRCGLSILQRPLCLNWVGGLCVLLHCGFSGGCSPLHAVQGAPFEDVVSGTLIVILSPFDSCDEQRHDAFLCLVSRSYLSSSLSSSSHAIYSFWFWQSINSHANRSPMSFSCWQRSPSTGWVFPGRTSQRVSRTLSVSSCDKVYNKKNVLKYWVALLPLFPCRQGHIISPKSVRLRASGGRVSVGVN